MSIFYPNMLNFWLYYVMLHVDAGDNPARHCHLGRGRHLYAVFVLICLACFMMCIFLCCMLFSCFIIDVSVFMFGKKLCRAYVIMLYTCRIKIKFSYLILSYLMTSLFLLWFIQTMAYNLHNIFKFIPEVINQREIYLVISLTEQYHSHRVTLN